MKTRSPQWAGHCIRDRAHAQLGAVRLLAIGFGLAVFLAGCTRPFYRKKADEEVADILREKDRYPAWKLESSHVYPDPRSRFADTANLDHPPMPPDDPATADRSPSPQKPGKAGVVLLESNGYLDLLATWDAENRAAEAARRQKEKQAGTRDPDSARSTPGASSTDGTPGSAGTTEFPDPLTSTNGPQPFLLELDQAVELGLTNSREFQDRREDLYLQALPVTAERFAFASQFAITEELLRQRLGKLFPGGPSNSWVSNSNIGLTKLFSTGALLMVSLANHTVFEFGNPNVRHTVSQSILDLDIVQPLLRGAGKAVTLEPLTLAERNLLYEIRDFARFRKQFYVNIAAGPDIGTLSTGAARFRNRPLDFFNGVGLVGTAPLRPGSGVLSGVPASGGALPSGFLPGWKGARNQYLPLVQVGEGDLDSRKGAKEQERCQERMALPPQVVCRQGVVS
jgi:hypothetical protein